ncbi:MAG: hypothetical protein CMB80_25995 [Flammeovirgaceae bacterium]|nr:hypothetical protein [Flammeovirgaceae bacterium]|tara:strand:+ start:8496 stop:8927 length:432 start_codon:yes stop_codon:yes gene_type:complete
MRTLLDNLLKGETHEIDRHIYYDLSIEDHIKEWVETALKNKKRKVPLKSTKKQANLRLDEAERTIHTKHSLDIKLTKADLTPLQNKISDIKNRFSEYVESEKAIIPDELYERIDLLKAKLDKLQAQADEQEEFHSQSKSNDDE